MDSLENLLKKHVLGNLFLVLDFIVPKDEKIMVFTARRGRAFYDNSKYLFLNFLKHYNSEFKIYWCCSTSKTYKRLLHKIPRENLLYQHSLKGIWLLLRAKTLFFTHGVTDIKDFKLCTRKKNLILLWHAVAFKALFKANAEKNRKKKRVSYALITASSSYDKEKRIERGEGHAENIKITGCPRHDFLLEASVQRKNDIQSGKKIIFYAPTWRKNKKTCFFPFEDLNTKELIEFFVKYDIHLYLRPHYKKNSYYIKKTIPQSFSDRISLLDWEHLEDSYEILPYADILVTDYSSIFIDFLIFNRPMIFIPYDKDEYLKERGFLYDYEYITPGPKVTTQKSFIYWIKKSIENPNFYQQERERIKKIFFEFNDSESFRRIYKEVKKLL